MDYKIYERLDKDQQKLLCFYAFVGGAVNDQIIGKYAKANSDTTKAVVPRIKSLLQANFLTTVHFLFIWMIMHTRFLSNTISRCCIT